MLLHNKITHIYGLFDPRTTELRYIGKTVKTLEQRLSNHVTSARNCKLQRVARWIRGVILSGHLPEICIIEDVAPGDDWQESERFWIAYYRSIGANLVNTTDGGEGCSGFHHNDNFKSMVAKRNSDTGFKKKVAVGRQNWIYNTEAGRIWREKTAELNSSPEFIKKARAGFLDAYKKDPSIAKSMSEAAKKRWADNGNKKQQSMVLKAAQSDRLEARARCKTLIYQTGSTFEIPVSACSGTLKFYLETEQKLISELSPSPALAA